MSDLAYTATLIGGFAAVALLVRIAGMVLNADERRSERPIKDPRDLNR